jgi:hypothetical protein
MARAETTEIDPRDRLMERMATVLEKMGENTKPYEPGFGDPAYQERLRAEGYFDTFPIPVYQNGRECEAKGLSEETRARASALSPGKFLGGKVVVETSEGKFVHLKYKSVTPEDRMRSASWWKDFPDLVNQIWAEQHPA